MSNEPLRALSDSVSFWQGDLDRHEQTNVGVIVADDTAIVIDANFEGPARRILATIQDRDRATVTHQVNTHYHADHTLGNVVYAEAGATLIGAEGQRDELLTKGKDDSKVQTGNVPDRLYPVTVEFTDTIRFHQFELHLMAVGPAHSRGDLIAWLPRDGILFVGDLAVAWEHGNNFSDPDADIESWITALKRCKALRPGVVVPAHGRLSEPDVLDTQRAFISELWELALAAADRGDGLDDPVLERRLLAEHAEFAVNSERLREMSGSMLAAAKNRTS
ncbi:MAG: MBL fold metallo-hydrolase [Mycobacterium sp.]|nr:MBL fold metallo-hydrolase [Mycobacterium sp.]